MTSGRLTPAAATWISTSPAAGIGIGRLAGFKPSGPPGALISIAVMVAGSALMASILWTGRSIAPLAGSRHTGNCRKERGDSHGRGGSAAAQPAPGEEGSDAHGDRRAGGLHRRAR